VNFSPNRIIQKGIRTESLFRQVFKKLKLLKLLLSIVANSVLIK